MKTRRKRLSRRQRLEFDIRGDDSSSERQVFRILDANDLTRSLLHFGLPLSLTDREAMSVVCGCNIRKPDVLQKIRDWDSVPKRRIEDLWPMIYR